MPKSEHRPERPPTLSAGGLVCAVVLVAVVAAGAWIGVRGALAAEHLEAARGAAAALRAEGSSGGAVDAAALTVIGSDTAAARSLTSDPVWRVATTLPWIGPQLGSVAAAAASVDDAVQAASILSEAWESDGAEALRPASGLLDLSALERLRAPAAMAADLASGATDRLEAHSATPAAGALEAPLAEAADAVGQIAALTDAVRRATELLPTALGAEGPRDYLILVQNGAEWRSLGGIPGAVIAVRTDGGRVEMVEQVPAVDLPAPDGLADLLPTGIAALTEDRPARYAQDITMVPDMPTAGPLAARYWRARTGVDVDGVVTVDPVVLGALLRATGPVDVPGGERLDADLAAATLLNGVYAQRTDPAAQDAFFALAARAVFETFASGSADPLVALDALADAADERRILVWHADADEQAVLHGTVLAGELPRDDAELAGFGVYLNDGTGSKMSYYMEAGAATADCADGSASIGVDLRSAAPDDAASLPASITGGGVFGTVAGNVETVVYVVLPAGVTAIAPVAGAEDVVVRTEDRGREVLVWRSELAPGRATALHFRTSVLDRPSGLVMTPVADHRRIEVGAPTCGP